MKPFFPGKAREIRTVDVERYITRRSAKVSPATVRREVVTLKYCLSKAVARGIIAVNPAQTVELRRVPPGRVRYLQPTELQILLSHCPDWLKPIVELAVATGMRRGEILSLRHLDVDLTHGCLMLRQTKNGEGRIVPLNAWAQRILTALPSESPTQRLFTVKPAHVTVAFEGACK